MAGSYGTSLISDASLKLNPAAQKRLGSGVAGAASSIRALNRGRPSGPKPEAQRIVGRGCSGMPFWSNPRARSVEKAEGLLCAPLWPADVRSYRGGTLTRRALAMGIGEAHQSGTGPTREQISCENRSEGNIFPLATCAGLNTGPNTARGLLASPSAPLAIAQQQRVNHSRKKTLLVVLAITLRDEAHEYAVRTGGLGKQVAQGARALWVSVAHDRHEDGPLVCLLAPAAAHRTRASRA
eukprot:CAMPEP_0113663206 /NCGR_PEP_ID=MMETSP0038_2-20120614/1007_1 /TAXON_ID=2898 /ORGANISM="Cryptomonas paramecium" /LENGTH=238 /DNA_ID=CAMNT_0000578195 /DNA_START=771 /DNA_END=1486 /DNA_ORIENTATION=- /assembly_acc=CAM_ASM_000170